MYRLISSRRAGLATASIVASLAVVTFLNADALSDPPTRRMDPVMTGTTPERVSAPPMQQVDMMRTAFGAEARSIDGMGNNVAHSTWGSAGQQLRRMAEAEYGDGVSSPAGATRPGARALSNELCQQTTSHPNSVHATDFLWMWGQFIDHDIDLSDAADPDEPFDIPVPMGDAWFDPSSTGSQTIPMSRSNYDSTTGTDASNPRQQVNAITAFVDGSNVYGSDPIRAATLRTNDGTGRLATSAGNLLPFNTTGLPNAGGTDPTLFLAGDIRANEQLGLTSLHTLFVREHNRLATQIAAAEPLLDGDEIYERARALVGAEIQAITYNEFLPVLLGAGALTPYSGYDPSVNPGIANEFSTGAYRLGHTMLSSVLMRLDHDGYPIAEGNLALRDAFFAPERIIDEGGIEPILRGAAIQSMQDVDMYIVDEVRNFLFGPPGAGGFDLAALNIQRGRDHGLANYNAVRVAYGLPAVNTWTDISSNSDVQAHLQSMYGTVNDVDLWIGVLAEDHTPGTMVGELLRTVLKDQFERLRDGDRFWYQNVFTGSLLDEIENTRLADIIRRNTAIDDEIQDDVFTAASAQGETVPTVSMWGLMILAMSMGVAGKLIFGHRWSTAVNN